VDDLLLLPGLFNEISMLLAARVSRTRIQAEIKATWRRLELEGYVRPRCVISPQAAHDSHDLPLSTWTARHHPERDITYDRGRRAAAEAYRRARKNKGTVDVAVPVNDGGN